MQTAFGWLGSKRRLARHLLTKIPNHSCYVEPFFGSGALFLSKDPVRCEVINDAHDELINFYRVLQQHSHALIDYLIGLPTSRVLFQQFVHADLTRLTDIQRAARFYYLVKNSFGCRLTRPSFGTTTTTGPKHNVATLGERLAKISTRFQHVHIENLDWQAVAQRYDRPHSFMYFDPPYDQVTGYGAPFEDYPALADFMRNAQSKVMLSINATPRMNQLFVGFHKTTIEHQHGLKNAQKKPVLEMVYTNY